MQPQGELQFKVLQYVSLGFTACITTMMVCFIYIVYANKQTLHFVRIQSLSPFFARKNPKKTSSGGLQGCLSTTDYCPAFCEYVSTYTKTIFDIN